MFQRIIAATGLFVTFIATALGAVDHRLTVRDYPAAWRSGANGSDIVLIDSKIEWNSDGIGAYLDADHFIRSNGLQPQILGNDKAVGKMRLMTLDQIASSSKIARAMSKSSDAMFGIAVGVDGALELVGRNADSVRAAIRFFANAQSRNLCIETECVGRPSTAERATPQPTKNAATSDEVWQLGRAGSPRGWSALGEGSKQFRFIWHRPANWEVLDSPMLRLHAAATASSTVDLQQSAITIRINDRPVATYSIGQWRNGKADIRIPRELWNAGEWAIELQTFLKLDTSKKPAASNPDVAWIHISPETALLVPHQKLPYQGIGSFYDTMTASGILRLQNNNFSRITLARIAPLLYPFAANANQEGTLKRWQVADALSCQKSLCVQIAEHPAARAPLTLSDHAWQDISGQLGMPDIESNNTVAMFYIPTSVNQVEHLQIVLAPTSPNAPTLSPPDYAGLVGQVALFADKWHIFDVRMNERASPRPPPVAAKSAENNLSTEQRRLRLLNFVWAAMSVLVVAGLLFWFWRKPKNRQPDEHWEMH